MRIFQVNVNGTSYRVELEEIDQPTAATPAPVSAAATAPQSAVTEGEPLLAPMPGTILSVAVALGETVKKGQLLLVLEAMKMENEIVSPVDGRIAAVFVSQGRAVAAGDTLLCIV